ncbi:MAG: glycine--tRNA ligase [Bacteroidia bacterium]|jgi:glycyl-tRNA synthetase|nr:glycine--tRNA ligase [Bacteroidia bacterium]MDG2042543.1 glycine--tRNA ligase [Bacteroidia bacterium]|tara:strand:+ start:2039 stop:3574 length:1536 start_codon:yes stop_codon:yes gene_type:complete
MSEEHFKNVISHAKEYGFVFLSSEIYDGLAAVYDYGQNGVELKKNIREYWWKSMVQLHDNIVGVDASIFMAPQVWKASGHVDGFSDPMIDNKDSKKRYRADVLIEDYQEKYRQKNQKEITKAKKRFGDDFDLDQFVATNPNIARNNAKIAAIDERLKKGLESENLDLVKELIEELGIACPVSGSKNWTDVRQFNLMYSTQMSATDGDNKIYLRPETAQGIFVNYLNVQKTGRMKLPFGIAQTGKAFRNEIVARQFIMRMKEFEQMEMQFFVTPGKEMEWYQHWKDHRMKWHLNLGIDHSKYRFHDHVKLAHYANAAVDIEYDFPFGFKEVEGIHSRTDFDLKQHEHATGKKLQYFDNEKNESYVPYVVETSIGLDRMFLVLMSNALQTQDMGDGQTRTVLKLPPALSPFQCAILPLVKKDGLPELAKKIMKNLSLDFNCYYEEKDSIGKRYRRQDAIGTPICITVDHDSMTDQAVTIRFRDTMDQKRVSLNELNTIIEKEVSMRGLLSGLI